MTIKIESEAHQFHAERKADRAIEAIELLAAVMVKAGAYEDRIEALAYMLRCLEKATPGSDFERRAQAAEVWAQIGLAAGHLEGVRVHGVEEVDKLPIYRSSRPLIIERLARLLGPPVEHPADPFEGLVR